MDPLTAILACSLYADDNLVRAIVQSTSSSNPYSVVDASAVEPDGEEVAPPPPPQSGDEALKKIDEITRRGGKVLIGLMQVRPAWVATFGREIPDVLDSCANISIGTAMLAEFEHQCSAEAKPAPVAPARKGHKGALRPLKPVPSSIANRPCVLRKYAEAIEMPEFTMVVSLELDYQKAKSLASLAYEAPIFFSTPADRAWGTDRIFFQASMPEVKGERPAGQ